MGVLSKKNEVIKNLVQEDVMLFITIKKWQKNGNVQNALFVGMTQEEKAGQNTAHQNVKELQIEEKVILDGMEELLRKKTDILLHYHTDIHSVIETAEF